MLFKDFDIFFMRRPIFRFRYLLIDSLGRREQSKRRQIWPHSIRKHLFFVFADGKCSYPFNSRRRAIGEKLSRGVRESVSGKFLQEENSTVLPSTKPQNLPTNLPSSVAERRNNPRQNLSPENRSSTDTGTVQYFPTCLLLISLLHSMPNGKRKREPSKTTTITSSTSNRGRSSMNRTSSLPFSFDRIMKYFAIKP